jgi:hypothetical protein
MIIAIDEYFQWADYKGLHYTLSGLSLFLGFDSRDSLRVYEDYSDGFFSTLKRAKTIIEDQRVQALLNCKTSPVGMIFDLKNNFGWKDVTEVNHTGSLKLSDDELHRKLGVLMQTAYRLGVISQTPQPALPSGDESEKDQ